LGAAVAGTLHWHRCRVVEDQVVLADSVGAVVAAPDLFPGQLRMPAASARRCWSVSW
jgi:hypothetical protein